MRDVFNDAGDRDERPDCRCSNADCTHATEAAQVDATRAEYEQRKRDGGGVPDDGADAEEVQQRAEIRRGPGRRGNVRAWRREGG